MSIDGTITTRKGRVVYNRKDHAFTQRDAARVLRNALGLGDFFSLNLSVDDYAQYAGLSAVSFLGRYGLFPYAALTYEQQLNTAGRMADQLVRYVANYTGWPEWMIQLGEGISAWFLGQMGYNPYVNVYKMQPFWADNIVQTLLNTAQLPEEDIYGRRKNR